MGTRNGQAGTSLLVKNALPVEVRGRAHAKSCVITVTQNLPLLPKTDFADDLLLLILRNLMKIWMSPKIPAYRLIRQTSFIRSPFCCSLRVTGRRLVKICAYLAGLSGDCNSRARAINFLSLPSIEASPICSSCRTPSASTVKVCGMALTENILEIGPVNPPSRYCGQVISFFVMNSFHLFSSESRLMLRMTSGSP